MNERKATHRAACRDCSTSGNGTDSSWQRQHRYMIYVHTKGKHKQTRMHMFININVMYSRRTTVNVERVPLRNVSHVLSCKIWRYGWYMTK